MSEDVLELLDELGDDTDLILQPDEWLENHRIDLQMRMSLLAEELSSVLSAQRIKTHLKRARMNQDTVENILKKNSNEEKD